MDNKEVTERFIGILKTKKARAALSFFLPQRVNDTIKIFLEDNDYEKLASGLEMVSKNNLQVVTKIEAITSVLERITELRAPSSKPIVTIGGANAENVLTFDNDGELTLGEKYSVRQENYVGGSCVNFTSWLLADNRLSAPILVAGTDQIGNNIKNTLFKLADQSSYSDLLKVVLDSDHFLNTNIKTPVTTILLNNKQRTIFKQELIGIDYIDAHLQDQLEAIGSLFENELGAILIGHIESDAQKKENKERKKEPTSTIHFIDEGKSKYRCLIYCVLGKNQYEYGCEIWEKHLQKIDVLQLNIREAKIFFSKGGQSTRLYDMLKWFIDRRVAVVLTMDQFGAIGTDGRNNRIFHVWPLLESDAVKDPTGAGDAFAAGMVAKLTEKQSYNADDFGNAMQMGNIWAACACTVPGATGAKPNEELKKYKNKFKDITSEKIESMNIDHAKKLIRFIDLAYQG